MQPNRKNPIGTQHSPSRTDRGVSPVLGVILMVALTVVLAAVVGAFALSFSDQLTEPAPTNTIAVDWTDNGDVEMMFTHRGGDSVDWYDIQVSIEAENMKIDDAELTPGSESFSVGETVRTVESLEDDATYEVRMIHEPTGTIIASETVVVPVL